MFRYKLSSLMFGPEPFPATHEVLGRIGTHKMEAGTLSLVPDLLCVQRNRLSGVMAQ